MEDVILLGGNFMSFKDFLSVKAPVSASPSQWRQICSVVGGRVINGYCQTDWLLRFLYRFLQIFTNYIFEKNTCSFCSTMSVQFIIAGTGPVENKNERKIVNFNLSHIVCSKLILNGICLFYR